jgi:hypothetical protein
MMLVGKLPTLDARIALEKRVITVTTNGHDASPILDFDEHRACGVTDPAEGSSRLGHVVRN